MILIMWRMWKFKISVDASLRRWVCKAYQDYVLNLVLFLFICMSKFYRATIMGKEAKKKHEGRNISLPKIIHYVTKYISMFVKIKIYDMRGGSCWLKILKQLEDYKPRVKVIQVKWEYPPT
ncbi:hypothetical protein H5410_052680 [Solanum commersonii]|uniref:Uncharacterized protein n=1 Tax=Solanum commersonii TaxID=4109 RepID=A0A9J5X3Q6_SOLCO|nr:hypothetical protein H5410_052680 [Solanum commersonii]